MIHAMLQIPLAFVLSVLYFREAIWLSQNKGKQRRITSLWVLGSFAGAMLAWRFSVVVEVLSEGWRINGGQLLQTLLLIGFIVAYLELKEPRRKK